MVRIIILWCGYAGAGIYVYHAISSNTGSSYGRQGSQPNNSYAVVDTGLGSRSTRLEMYCCSNSSSSNTSFTFPNGYTTSSNYKNAHIAIESINSGCFVFHYHYNRRYNFTLLKGVHTCSIPDSNGNNIDVHIGLYEEGFNSKHNGS